MEWLDRHFAALPQRKKAFLVIICGSYFLIAAVGYWSGLMDLFESFLLFVVGVIYTELLKLQYRIVSLEKEDKKNKKR